MQYLDFITWQPDPEIFNLFGRSVRWYGVLFALGFILGQRIATRFFKFKGYDEKLVDSFVIYTIIGTVVGARLGHVLFYGPHFDGPEGQGYFDHPLSIFYIWKGGLASHGAMFGLLASTFLFYKKKIQEEYFWLTDRLVIAVALAGGCIRFGNLMNSEIIGTPTSVSHGFVFSYNAENSIYNQNSNNIESISFEATDKGKTEPNYQNLNSQIVSLPGVFQNEEHFKSYVINKVIPNHITYNNKHPDHSHVIFNTNTEVSISRSEDQFIAQFQSLGIPRHPSQLYESISSFILAAFLFLFLDKKHKTIPAGVVTGIFFTYIFTLRFFYEFFKEVQVSMEDGWVLNMGQLLSIPAVLFGLGLIYYANRKNRA